MSTYQSTMNMPMCNHSTPSPTVIKNYEYLQLLQHAALLNSAGVTAMMTNGESDTSLQIFNEALCVMEKVSACPFLEKSGSQVPRVWNTVKAPQMEDDRFFVCPQALLFNVSDKPVISEVDLSFYSSIIIFNMALAYHQRALISPFQTDSMLQNALQLYDHCYQILGTILSPPGDDTDMLKLVTLNNQAQIHYMTQNFAQAHQMLQQLRELCPVLIKNRSPTDPGVFHTTQTMKEIGMNVLLVTGPPSAAPSA